MITREQAVMAREFHEGTCKITIGRMGGIKVKSTKLRRNGGTQTWATRPNQWRITLQVWLLRLRTANRQRCRPSAYPC